MAGRRGGEHARRGGESGVGGSGVTRAEARRLRQQRGLGGELRPQGEWLLMLGSLLRSKAPCWKGQIPSWML